SNPPAEQIFPRSHFREVNPVIAPGQDFAIGSKAQSGEQRVASHSLDTLDFLARRHIPNLDTGRRGAYLTPSPPPGEGECLAVWRKSQRRDGLDIRFDLTC